MAEWIVSLEGTDAGRRLALCLALLAALLHAFFGALQKGKTDPWTARTVIDASYALLAVPFLFLVPPPPTETWPLFAVAWIIHVAYKTAQASAYSVGAYTVVYPVVRGTGPVFTVIGAGILFVIGYTTVKPEAGPALPPEERVSTREKFRLLGNMFAPLALVTLVLGIIFAGIATPVEAAGVGTFGAVVVAAMHRRLSWENLRAATMTTLRVTGMVLWIIFGATLFVGFYVVNGGQAFVNEVLLSTGLGPYGILILMMVILVVLGMFLVWVGILLLAVPIFVPIMKSMSFDGVFGLPGVDPTELALWFGVVYMVNMQMSFLSPPFGYALFYLKSVAPPGVTMAQIYRSSLPFLGLQIVGLSICIIFPETVLWLPRLVYG